MVVLAVTLGLPQVMTAALAVTQGLPQVMAALAVTQGLSQAMAALAVTLACLVLDPIRKQGQLCPPTTPTHPNACLLWTLPL